MGDYKRFYIPKYKFHLTNEQNELVHGRTCSKKIEKEFQLYETPSDESLKEMVEMPTNSKNIPGLYVKHESNEGSWVRGSTSTNYSKNDLDYHRKLAFHGKENDILKINEGIIPRYAGYVPGNKFKFGNTFYRETINVKEVDVPISTTWGGSLSLFN